MAFDAENEDIKFLNIDNETECGRIYSTTDGNLKFYCTLCETEFFDFSKYESHLDIHFLKSKLNCADNIDETVDVKEHLNSIDCKKGIEVLFNNDDLEKCSSINPTTKTTTCQDDDVLKENEVEFKELKRKKILHVKGSIIEEEISTPKKRKYPRAKEFPVCPICSEVLSKNTHLKTHMKRHTDHRDYKCSFCPKAFFTRCELDTHIRSHTGERPYLCTECGTATTTKSKLSAHIRQKHSRQRDKLCSICNMSFYSSVLLKNHMITHSDERPFQCKLCESKFKRRKGLQSHLKSHENKKEFQCDICLVRFNQKCNLNSHRKKKHAIATDNKDGLSIF